MNVQECAAGGIELVDLPPDPQFVMISTQRALQVRVYGEEKVVHLRDFGVNPKCDPYATLHHLDMGVQECSEAWDLVEGGWKHHKTHPRPGDRGELLMELVDVTCFALNAFVFMGGQPEAEMVAASVGRAKETIRLPRIGLEEVWGMGERSWDRHGARARRVYGHHRGAHGQDWEKEVATRVNFLRAQFSKTAETLRYGLERMSAAERRTFPPSSGFVYIELMPYVCMAVQGLPDISLREFYSAYVAKSAINTGRQDAGY